MPTLRKSRVRAYSYGDQLLVFSDNEESTTEEDPIKLKEIALAHGGNLRIKFQLKNSIGAANSTRGRIDRNGVAVGTVRTTNSTTFVNFSEDIAGWAPGDRCELYVWRSPGTSIASCRWFRLYGERIMDTVMLS